jgi:hypothetical protein
MQKVTSRRRAANYNIGVLLELPLASAPPAAMSHNV